MNAPERVLARDIRDLAGKLAEDGWDRLRVVRLLQIVSRVNDAWGSDAWLEASGRATALADMLTRFAQEMPRPQALAQALRAANSLADLLDAGRLGALVDRDSLPARPEDWRFVLLGEVPASAGDLAGTLQALGFTVAQADGFDAAVAGGADNLILVAAATWVAGHAQDLAAARTAAAGGPAPLLVALADSDDFLAQVRTRQAGAHLLLDLPLDLPRLFAELAGLAWLPRATYRVLVVDDDSAVLEAHARILRDAGFEVLAVDDPVAARDFLDEFAPEACVLDVEMPACRGTDLAAVLRRKKQFARLPVIYLSGFADIEHQLEARHAGGEDYLTKPVDPRLLLTAVLARARQFRLFEVTYRQRRQAWRHLDNLRNTLDAHALVSVADLDGTIVHANDKFCQVSGYSLRELIGQNHRIVKSGHHPAAFFAEMWGTLCEGRIWQGEVKNRRKDGSHYWVQNTIVPTLDEHGLPFQYIAVRTDITEHKRILAGRERQARLLGLLNQALHEFITSQDIEASSSLLLEGLLQLTDSAYGILGEVRQDPDGATYLHGHAIANATAGTTSHARDIRTHATGMELRRPDSLIGSVLAGNTVMVNDPAADALPGHPALQSFLGLPIRAGSNVLGVLTLANRPGGYDDATQDFLQTFTSTYAAILEAGRRRQFQQQAIGDLQQARDAVEQAERTRTEYLGGWSQGLHTALNAMVGHAQILLMSDGLDAAALDGVREIVRGGQQFTRLLGEMGEQVLLPQAPAPAPAPRPTEAAPQPRVDKVRHRILVAEDNQANQAVLRMQLDVLGYEPEVTGDGVAAMARWQAGAHALILADRHMPGMDGLELARAIRARERESGGHIPIIAITALQNPEDIAQCRTAGMDDALPKPIELDDLRRMLERWLQHTSPPEEVCRSIPVAAPAPAGVALDLAHLARIVGHADTHQARELVDLFTMTVRGDLPACHRHVAEHNGRALGLVMHKLKSSARMVGALRFAGLAEALESATKAGLMEGAGARLRDLEQALDDVETALARIEAFAVAAEPATVAQRNIHLPRQVLVVDDDPVARRQLSMLLTRLGVGQVLSVDDGAAALAELDGRSHIDLIISDLNMPGMDGVEFLRRLAGNAYRGDLILSSGVEERLLQTAADFARARNMRLRGTLKKPVTRDALEKLLTRPSEKPSAAAQVADAVSPEDILDGIRRDEFEVHFQPKVEAATLRAVGVEALARWTRAGKPVSPDEFITTAERHGLIGQLSEVLITKSLVGGAQLAAAGYPLAVSVNISANWLTEVHLPEFIMASILATGFRAENLILDITETGLMADMATALDVMSRLRLKGFKLSIDDFGTGYSSMEQLQRFPFGELKLDRGFVQGAAANPASRAILASMLEIALKLKLTTVAEGVETQADLDLVRGLGCDLVQGWLVARAMPLERLIDWLRAREGA